MIHRFLDVGKNCGFCLEHSLDYLLSWTNNNAGWKQVTREVVISSVKRDEARMGRVSDGGF